MSVTITTVDLNRVYTATYDARNKWRNILLSLGVENATIKSIGEKWRDNPDDCYREGLFEWLEGGGRSWEDLMAALSSPTVGHKDIAMDIERKYMKHTILSITPGSAAAAVGPSNPHHQVINESLIILSNEKIGAGAFGVVFKGSYKNKPCAVKVLHQVAMQIQTNLPVCQEADKTISTFDRECEFLKSFQHPNIVQHLSTEKHPTSGSTILVTELMDCNLRSYLSGICDTSLASHCQVSLSKDVASGLAFIHSRQIIHRDLCGDNVLLKLSRPIPVAKISDFGMSRLLDPSQMSSTLTAIAHRMGFLPPEALRLNDEKYDYSLDVFSLGVVILQIVCKAETIKSPKDRLAYLSQMSGPNRLKHIIRDCLQDDKERRPTARNICTMLERDVREKDVQNDHDIEIRLPAHSSPSTYGNRFYHELQPYFYPYGNTPARDFLEYAPSNAEKPSILVLGCGDIRSCFYTVWKNFRPEFEKCFKGVQFVLNDRSAAVLARNVLFIYLCLKLPKDATSRQKWTLAIWSIWFCHELLPDHDIVLRNALKELLVFSIDHAHWSSSECPLREFVSFNHPSNLEEIRKYWSIWYYKDIKLSVEDMRIARRKCQNKVLPSLEFELIRAIHETCGLLGRDLSASHFDTMKQEYRAYLESGSAFCEHLFEMSAQQTEESERTVNLTLFEREDGTYTFHYSSAPFRCFHQSYVYNFDKMRKLGMHIPEYDIEITSRKCNECPLLASSFQQFCVWILGTAHALQNKAKIFFMFDCSNAFHFSHSWDSERNGQFDLVYASNLLDSVSPPALALAATRLLTKDGLFLSPTVRYKYLGPSFNEYIEATFGIPPSLLPLICGIRCINHESEKYSSRISHHHIPIDIPELEKGVLSIYESTCIWKKVDMTPICSNSLELLPDVCRALHNSFKVLCNVYMLTNSKKKLNNHSCTDTSILILKEFATRINSDSAKSHTFWAHLCTNLKADEDLGPFLTSIQTQAITNGLHLHLIIDDSTCPLCKGLPISTYIGQFCMEVKSDLIQDFVIVLLKKLSCTQYIDCFTQIPSEPSKLKLFFFAPITYVQEECDLTLVEYRQLYTESSASDLLKGKLSKYQIQNPYSISPSALIMSLSSCKLSSSIGNIVSHKGNNDSFETKLHLAVNKPALLTAPLKTIQLSPSCVEIKCMENSALIKYPYPVTKLVIQRSKKEKSLFIQAKRLPYEYRSDGQLFHVNPNDHCCLVPVMPSINLLEFQLKCQFSPNEWEIFCTDNVLSNYPVLKAKRIIFLMLTTMNDLFFRLQLVINGTTFNAGLIKVINRVVDVSRKSPALDVYFCFLDDFYQQTADSITLPIEKEYIKSPFDVKNFPINEKAYELVKAFILSFHSHTYQCENSFPLARKPPSLEKCKIKQFFKRAVIYPLYQDRDRTMHEIKTAKYSPDLKFVSPISLKYATKDPQHDLLQKPKPDLQPCTYCGKSGHTKKCSRCQKASYCGKTCQTNDWKQHKKTCTPTYDVAHDLD